MNKPSLIAAIVAAVALSAPVYAGPQKQDSMTGQESAATQMKPERGAAYGADAAAYEYGFQEVDRNQDGYISREEAQEHEELAADWDSADTDRDGKLSESEFSAFEDREADQSDKR